MSRRPPTKSPVIFSCPLPRKLMQLSSEFCAVVSLRRRRWWRTAHRNLSYQPEFRRSMPCANIEQQSFVTCRKSAISNDSLIVGSMSAAWYRQRRCCAMPLLSVCRSVWLSVCLSVVFVRGRAHVACNSTFVSHQQKAVGELFSAAAERFYMFSINESLDGSSTA